MHFKLILNCRDYFSKILFLIIGSKMKLRTLTVKFAVHSALKFFTKSILRSKVFTETTHKCGSQKIIGSPNLNVYVEKDLSFMERTKSLLYF